MSNDKLEQISNERKIILEEMKNSKYSDAEITDKDKKANDLFHSKIEPGFKFPEDFYYNLSMKYKSEIESHEFFKVLENMPKGCLLHHHMSDCIDIEWLSEEVMKKENLEHIYMRKFRNRYDILIFTKIPDENSPYFDRPFKDIIETYLKENKGKTPYDYFSQKLTIHSEELENVKNNDEAWAIFMPKYFFCYYLILYKDFYKQHIRNAFLQCIKDKQYRLESRLTPGRVKDENFCAISEEEEFDIYKKELDYVNLLNLETKFTFGIIVEMIRNKSDDFIINTIKKSIEQRKKYPDLICGIDLGGDENNFRTFQELAPVMINNTDEELPWILHCGETIRAKNYNLIDGFLIGAKRFGHCINLFKLGKLLEHIKNKGIILEINPISNQTLKQVRDLRMHPCIGYHNCGMKITINNDDPTLYNTKGVIYDFFVASTAMEFDLLDFKCFGLNSITGAQIGSDIKNEYKKIFLKNWEDFVDYFIEKYEKI